MGKLKPQVEERLQRLSLDLGPERTAELRAHLEAGRQLKELSWYAALSLMPKYVQKHLRHLDLLIQELDEPI